MNPDVIEFLQESNFIESEYSSEALDQAVKAWQYLVKQKELTIKNILKTHGILSKGFLDKENSGHFRKQPVWIGGHEAKPWYVVPELIAQWVEQANFTVQIDFDDPDHQLDIADEIKRDHVDFESIHPFIDGNGRMGRILLNWQRVKSGLPILVIKEAEKWDYYKWFK